MRVNKALHTCTSWYAYAAMFGTSFLISYPGKGSSLYVQLVKGGRGYPAPFPSCAPDKETKLQALGRSDAVYMGADM